MLILANRDIKEVSESLQRNKDNILCVNHRKHACFGHTVGYSRTYIVTCKSLPLW
jgi:hypothetical protein